MIKKLFGKIKDFFFMLIVYIIWFPFHLFYLIFFDTSRCKKKAIKKAKRIAKKRGMSDNELLDIIMKINGAGAENDVFKDVEKLNPYKDVEDVAGKALMEFLAVAANYRFNNTEGEIKNSIERQTNDEKPIR